jgi:protein-S-isoprenylcysteine O-methyltransferase Ste14
LCFFLGTGFMIAPLPVFLLSTLLFVIGTEIRVRIEDALLVSRFGDQFRDYQRTVPAYIPFLKYLRPANVRAKT